MSSTVLYPSLDNPYYYVKHSICIVPLCVFAFWVPCCDVLRFFCFFFLFFVCFLFVFVFVLFFVCFLFVFVFLYYLRYLFVQSGVQHIMFCVFNLTIFYSIIWHVNTIQHVICFVFFFLSSSFVPVLPISLDFSCFIALSVFSNVYIAEEPM